MSGRFDISLTNDFTLDIVEIWPDGDAPIHPTADDVIEKMREEGSIERLIGNWNLLHGVEINVTDEYWNTVSWDGT